MKPPYFTMALAVLLIAGILFMMGAAAAGGSQDIDGDGMFDPWEMEWLGSLNYTAENDTDGDGHTNFEEYQAQTDPLDPQDFPGADDDDDGGSDLLTLGIIIGLIVVLVLVIVGYYYLKTKKEKAIEDAASEDGAEEDEEDDIRECSECERLLPDQAVTCPDCGAEQPPGPVSSKKEEKARESPRK